MVNGWNKDYEVRHPVVLYEITNVPMYSVCTGLIQLYLLVEYKVFST